MKGEVKRYGSDGQHILAKRDINDNTYIVAIVPTDDHGYSHHVAVFADKKHGNDHGFPDGTSNYRIRKANYDSLTGSKVRNDMELAPAISKAVNQAVNKLTGHLEDIKSQEDAVLGALEANANVHEEDG